jgi:hypothetical protein
VARRRGIVRRVVPVLALAAVLILAPWPLTSSLRGAAALAAVALAGEAAYRNLGHARQGGFPTRAVAG